MLRENRRAWSSSPPGWPTSRRRATIAPVVAFGTGVVSVYSSTSGVVLPAFLPMVPDLARTRRRDSTPLPIAWSMNIGASLVDLSSLSTVGALFLAGAPPGTDTRALFNALLVWGLSMTVVGAALCWVLFGNPATTTSRNRIYLTRLDFCSISASHHYFFFRVQRV